MVDRAIHPHAELVEQCKSNDRFAQRKLYELYSGPMFNVCYRIVNQQEEAEDVLQEAFVRMFRQIKDFRQEASFGSWFKRIVINGALNHIKKKKRLQTYFDDMKDEHYDHITEEENGSDEVNYSVDQVRNAMEKLPEGYRVVFSLYLFENYSHKSIANELGISESTSKSQLSRAKKKIKEIIIRKDYENN